MELLYEGDMIAEVKLYLHVRYSRIVVLSIFISQKGRKYGVRYLSRQLRYLEGLL
jgi:hypothetical protein